MQIEPIILSTIQLVFALIFFCLYLFYPQAKENLIFTFLALLEAPITYLNFAEDTFVNLIILRVATMITICLGVYLLHTIFYKKTPKFLYYYMPGCVIMAAWILFDPRVTNTP